jgi:hypothetical protein
MPPLPILGLRGHVSDGGSFLDRPCRQPFSGTGIEGRHAMIPRRRFLHLAAGTAMLPGVSRIARAQAYPAKPVRIIVGVPRIDFPISGGSAVTLMKVRPQERHKNSGTSSCFFLRVPFLMRCLLLQCGQRSGSLIGERREGVRFVLLGRKTIRLADYQTGDGFAKSVRPSGVEYAKESVIFQASDLQGAGGGGAWVER